MRVSMKVDDGVRTLVDPAELSRDEPVHSSGIAARQSIPGPYLDQVLATLNKFGFIRSRRGHQGSHMLAKPPDDMTFGIVVSTLEGSSDLLDCLQEPDECILSGACAQRDVWQSVEEAVQTVLDPPPSPISPSGRGSSRPGAST